MKMSFKRFSAIAISAIITAVNLIPLCIFADKTSISSEQSVAVASSGLPAVTKIKVSSENSLLRFFSSGIFGKDKISVTVYAKNNSDNPISNIKLFSDGNEIQDSSEIYYDATNDSCYAIFVLGKGEYNLSAMACAGIGENQLCSGMYYIDMSQSNKDEVNEKEYTSFNENGSCRVLIEDKIPDIQVYPVHIDSVGNYIRLDSENKYSDGSFFSFTDKNKVWTNSAYDFFVSAYDENSGIYSISHKLSSLSDYTVIKTSDSIQNDCSVVVNSSNSTGECFISARAEDNSGNISYSVDSVHVETDSVPPSISIEKAEIIADSGISIRNYTENTWTNKRVKITVSADDSGSGADRIEMSANGGNVSPDNVSCNDKKVTYTYIVEPDFSGNVSFTAYDKVNNSSKSISYNVRIDTVLPAVTNFDMNRDINIQNYGFYLADNTKISVEAYDIEPYCSGIDCIELGTIDVGSMDSEYNYNENNINIVGRESVVQNASPVCSFEISAGFKGQIFARAVDLAGNTGKWRSLESLVHDSQEIHDESSYMGISIADAPYNDIDGNPLYDTDQKVTFNVKDSHAGIREIKWYVRTADGIIMGSDYYSDFTSGNNNGWTIQKKRDVITEATKEIVVSADKNNIEIGICFSDNSGFSTDWQVKHISIDKTSPEIVSFDFDDKSDKNIFNTGRTATVIVNERNIDTANELIDITLSDVVSKNSVPYKISDWELVSSDSEKTLYRLTMKFNADASYKINFNVQDISGKKSQKAVKSEFIIDTTAPVITISYDNNNAVNKCYYNADRKATIKIKEHNFKSDNVKYTLNALEPDGITKIKDTQIIPKKLEWTQNPDNKDEWSATVNFNKEGIFALNISCTDKADNCNSFKSGTFYIDKTAPEIKQTFTNGGKQFATNSLIVPRVTVSDYNFSYSEYHVDINKIDIDGKSNDNFICTSSSYTPVSEGKPAVYEFVYNVFAELSESDGIYDISIYASDFAGNTTEIENLNLSVNRQGSAFELINSEAKEIVEKFENDGTPVQEAVDIEIKEVNVSKRIGDSVIMVTRDNKKSYILTSEQYTTTEGKTAGGNSGWYETTYRIDKSVFADDGVYSIDIFTNDEVGNENSNKKSTVQFSIDATSPDITISGVQNNACLKESAVSLRITFSDRNLYSIDSMNSDDMAIKINDNIYNLNDLNTLNAGISNDEAGNIVILMDISADEKNYRTNMSASIVDRAGNVSEFKDSEINFCLASTFIVRNGWLFITVGSVVLLVLAIDIFFIIRKMRRN